MASRGRRSSRAAGFKRLAAPWLNALDHVLLLAGIVTALGLIYLLVLILTGSFGAPLIQGTRLQSLTANVNLAQKVFLYALWATVIIALVRHYRNEAVGYLVFAAGAVCYVALPFLVSGQIQPDTTRPLMELAQSLISGLQTSGGALMVLGFLRVVLGRIVSLSLPAPKAAQVVRRAAALDLQAEDTGRPTLMRNCWELQYCRGSLRRHCPRFIEQVSCWKRKSGCYCDQALAIGLLSGVGGDSRVEMAEELQAAQTRVRAQALSRRTRAKGKPPCGRCPIYLDHQKYKYRVLSWLAYPVAAAIVALNAQNIRYAYQWTEETLGSMFSQLQILPHPFADTPVQGIEWLSAENVIIFVTGLLCVGLILQMMEIAIFRLKL